MAPISDADGNGNAGHPGTEVLAMEVEVTRNSHYNLRKLQKVYYGPEKKRNGTVKRVYNRRVKLNKVTRSKVNPNKCGEMFPVEEVIKRRGRKGHYQFLLKWEGYPSTSNSWEPAENLSHDLIENYEKSLRKNLTSTTTTKEITSYTVERILGRRVQRNGSVEFFIKWLDHPETHNSWEPENLINCPEWVQQYEVHTHTR